MRRKNVLVCTAALMVLISSCGSREPERGSGNQSTQYEENDLGGTVMSDETEEAGTDNMEGDVGTEEPGKEVMKRMIMVNGDLYAETDEETPTPTCGTMDGSILSIVAEGETPAADGQANFGNVGDGYQYADQDCLSVPMNEKWIRFKKVNAGNKKSGVAYSETGDVFEKEVNALEGVSMVVLESSPVSARVEISNTTSRDIQFGDDYDLQKLVEGKWYSVPYIIDNWAFHAIAYPAAEGKPVEWEAVWEEFHGTLSAGTYRIVKKILDFRGTGDYTEYYLAAEFSV